MSFAIAYLVELSVGPADYFSNKLIFLFSVEVLFSTYRLSFSCLAAYYSFLCLDPFYCCVCFSVCLAFANEHSEYVSTHVHREVYM